MLDAPGTSAQHVDFEQAPGPTKSQGSCSGGRALRQRLEGFLAQPTAMVGAEQGKKSCSGWLNPPWV